MTCMFHKEALSVHTHEIIPNENGHFGRMKETKVEVYPYAQIRKIELRPSER